VRRIARIALGYGLWLASAALSLWGLLVLRTVLVVDLPIGLLRVSGWSLRLWNYVGSVFVGLVWLIFVIATEGYFTKRSDETLPVVLVRAAKMLCAQVVFVGIVYGLHLLV
jgi:hypothetical protein